MSHHKKSSSNAKEPFEFRRGSCLFLATVEPLQDINKSSKETGAHTFTERIALSKRYRDMPFQPVLMEHGGFEIDPKTNTFQVPPRKAVGRIIYYFVRCDGSLMCIGEIYHEFPNLIARLVDEHKNGKVMGVSLGKDMVKWFDRFVTDKEITHLGLTRNPDGGTETQIHVMGTSPEAFYPAVEDFFAKDTKPPIFPDPDVSQTIRSLVDHGREALTQRDEARRAAAGTSQPQTTKGSLL